MKRKIILYVIVLLIASCKTIKEYDNSVLNLKNKNLTEFPNDYSSLYGKVKKLYLGGNSFVELPKSVFEFKNLIALEINQNPVAKIPIDITQLEYLKILDISGTRIMSFPNLKDMSNLKFVLAYDLGLTEKQIQAMKCNLPPKCELLFSKERREYPPYICN
ncbi:MAG: leucine-rich repeat domain-containing protein [Chlorobi bacterium]|nr:leucine-rich repeat domain-containing protein [Chlorobiota bacterium]